MPYPDAMFLPLTDPTPIDTKIVPVFFQPDYAEEAAAAMVARYLFLQTIDDRSVVDGTGAVHVALSAYRARGLRVRPAILLTWLAMSAAGVDTAGGAGDLVDFEERFAGVGPSLALGALLAGGTAAAAPPAGTVVEGLDEAVEALARGTDGDAGAVLDLENMARAFGTGDPSLHQAAVCLTGPPSGTAATVLRQRAMEHGRWCIAAYLRATGTPD